MRLRAHSRTSVFAPRAYGGLCVCVYACMRVCVYARLGIRDAHMRASIHSCMLFVLYLWIEASAHSCIPAFAHQCNAARLR